VRPAPRSATRPFRATERNDDEPSADPYVPARRPASRGFTVTLDPDVARVFRGDASVNKALRLVLQLMQVVEGPPTADRAQAGDQRAAGRSVPPRAYKGSAEARGFERKPRFAADDDEGLTEDEALAAGVDVAAVHQDDEEDEN
jgi:hypothetical protein